nr:retrovirus-related Pol polyprotein from transposon TNT 1-94 [Tanacetum cinerariifolium]
MTGAKFDIEKLNEIGDFELWRVKMHVLSVQHGCQAPQEGLPTYMKVEAKLELNKKAHSVVILCLSNKVLREVIRETTTTGVWTKLDTEEKVVYILHIKFEDEDLALLLLTSLPASYEHFVDIMKALTLEDARQGNKNLSELYEGLSTVTQTSLGPSGTSLFLNELVVQLPTAKLLVLAAKEQQKKFGDGANLVVSNAGQHLEGAKELITMGLSNIING